MRRIISFNQEWIFTKEGKREKIQLPHTWNQIDGQDGGDDYYRGSCLYEKEFDNPIREEQEQVYLEFEGVNASARVWVNQNLAETHEGGYSAFRLRITDFLKEKNKLEVQADNSVNDRIYPQKADFTFYGGIYRGVKLIVVPPVHFSMEEYGTPGIKIEPKVWPGYGEVKVTAFLQNPGLLKESDVLRVTVYDTEKEVACREVTGLQTWEERMEAVLSVENPHLWQGVEDPYLYRAKVELLSGENSRDRGEPEQMDEVTLQFGFRRFYVDPEKGFFLNGKPYPLRGVSRHQDREGVGNALTREMHLEDMELIREIGANSIRLAHYQHDQYFYDLCDEYGMVVWAEIPYITCHMDTGRENTLSQMRELILQNHHHASICFWGISNEVSVGGVTENVLENNRQLNRLAKELDNSRLTAMACAFMLDETSPMLEITDVIAYNHYFGWYHGEVEETDEWFDHFHQNHPNLSVGLSEYGADAVLQWQTAKPERGDYTEQYQAFYHEHILNMLDNRSYIWCSYVWNMFDFGADGRDEGGVRGRNNKGLVTLDRRCKKDAFYLYKAWWSSEPFVYIAGKRYEKRWEKKTEITVYSNQSRVDLYVNGVFQESQEGYKVFHFQTEMKPTLEVAVKGENGESDTAVFQGTAQPESSYILDGGSDVENWFTNLISLKEDCFTLDDKVGELVKYQDGLTWFREFMAVYDSRKKGSAAAVHMTEEQRLSTMKTMRLKELMKRTNTPAEEVREWLEKLQKIQK